MCLASQEFVIFLYQNLFVFYYSRNLSAQLNFIAIINNITRKWNLRCKIMPFLFFFIFDVSHFGSYLRVASESAISNETTVFHTFQM